MHGLAGLQAASGMARDENIVAHLIANMDACQGQAAEGPCAGKQSMRTSSASRHPAVCLMGTAAMASEHKQCDYGEVPSACIPFAFSVMRALANPSGAWFSMSSSGSRHVSWKIHALLQPKA
jgi:hypothetical protein